MTDFSAWIRADIPPADHGCTDCEKTGAWWLHLRRCAYCGHIGCCDQSPHQHASRHAAHTGHAVIQSFEPDEEWFWDFGADEYFDGPPLAAPTSHPRSQPVPGPAGRVPTNWVDLLHLD
jgi:hypothetical protein